MGRLDRFGRLEGPREGQPGPRSEPSVEGRFRPAPPPPKGAPIPEARSGGEPGRFEEAETAPRVLELGEGQGFVRCALCRHDHHATAVRCTCGALLTTREQRDFNEALWRRQLEEKTEQEAEIARMREKRDEDLRAQAEALRQWQVFVETERAGGSTDVWRRAGLAIGGWLRRLVPNRTARFLLVGAVAGAVLFGLGALSGRLGQVFLLGALLMVVVPRVVRLFGRDRS